MDLGSKLRKARLDLNLSQADLSNMTGISSRSLWDYEHSKKIPKLETIMKIAFVLQLPLESLVDFSPAESIPVEQYKQLIIQRKQENIINTFLARCKEEDPEVKQRAVEVLEKTIKIFFSDELNQQDKDKLYLYIAELYLQTKKSELHPSKEPTRQRAPKNYDLNPTDNNKHKNNPSKIK